MPQTFTLQNGERLSVDDDDSRDDILRAVKILDPDGSYKEFLSEYGKLKAEEERAGSSDLTNRIADQTNLWSQGATFGLEDEVTAGIRGIGAALIPGGDTFSDAYDKTHSERNAYLDLVREDTNLVNQLVAEYGLPTALVTKFVLKAPKLARRLFSRKASRQEIDDAVRDTIEPYGASSKGVGAAQRDARVSGNRLAERLAQNRVVENDPGLISKGVQTAATAGGAYAGPIAAGGLLGATKADQGERTEGLLTGAVAGKGVSDAVLGLPFSPRNILELVGQ